jgi:hypothetical protein
MSKNQPEGCIQRTFKLASKQNSCTIYWTEVANKPVHVTQYQQRSNMKAFNRTRQSTASTLKGLLFAEPFLFVHFFALLLNSVPNTFKKWTLYFRFVLPFGGSFTLFGGFLPILRFLFFQPPHKVSEVAVVPIVEFFYKSPKHF